MDLDRHVLRQVESLVEEAGRIALRAFRPGAPTTARVTYKNGTSPVTQADLDVDEFLRDSLGTAFAGVGWLSEESIADPARLGQDHVFIVDPIDGTRAFLSGDPRWTISVALVERGRPSLAVLHAPALRETFLAIRGAGAQLNGALLMDTAPHEGPVRVAGPATIMDRCAGAFDIIRQPKIPSLAYRLAQVAANKVDLGLASANSHDWDIAAADLVLEEAGFCLTTLDDRKPLYNKRETHHGALVAAREPLHKAALKALRQ